MASRWSKKKKEDNRANNNRFERDEIRDITRQAKRDTREEAKNGSLIDIINDLSSPDKNQKNLVVS